METLQNTRYPEEDKKGETKEKRIFGITGKQMPSWWT